MEVAHRCTTPCAANTPTYCECACTNTYQCTHTHARLTWVAISLSLPNSQVRSLTLSVCTAVSKVCMHMCTNTHTCTHQHNTHAHIPLSWNNTTTTTTTYNNIQHIQYIDLYIHTPTCLAYTQTHTHQRAMVILVQWTYSAGGWTCRELTLFLLAVVYSTAVRMSLEKKNPEGHSGVGACPYGATCWSAPFALRGSEAKLQEASWSHRPAAWHSRDVEAIHTFVYIAIQENRNNPNFIMYTYVCAHVYNSRPVTCG